MTILNKRLTYGRLERIQFDLREYNLTELLKSAGEIPEGFMVKALEFFEDTSEGSGHVEVTLERITATPGAKHD